MAYDEHLAERVRSAFPVDVDVAERKMFGGVAFMANGHMACGVAGEELMLRLGAEGAGAALAEEHVRPMDFTGRPLKGMVFVGSEGLAEDAELREWIGRALAFVEALPPKT